MLRIWLLAFCMLIYGGVRAQNRDVLAQLTDNINSVTLDNRTKTRSLCDEFISVSEQGTNGDVMLLELYVVTLLPDDQIESLVSGCDSSGRWADIDYSDRRTSSWPASNHLTRIHAMAKAYKSRQSGHYNSPSVSKALHRALDFWFRTMPVCDNWWYNEIGGPKMLAPALLLLRDELSEQELAAADKYLSASKIAMTGQNRVWLSGNVLIRSLLKGDLNSVVQARDAIVSEIFLSTQEGLQPDYSFHQHGAQMQFGNYGLAYAGNISYWARVFSSTPLAISEQQLELLRNYTLQGLRWTIWRGRIDASASARQVFENSQRGKALSVAVSMRNMMIVDPKMAPQYESFIKENQENTKAVNTLTGHKYYYRSDYAIHRTKSWYASVRMHSERLIGYEMTNHENLQGVYASDGALMLMLSGMEYDNIYPLWDWKRLPGTTVTDDSEPIAYHHPEIPVNDADFVGGLSDGAKGISAMVLNRRGLKAQKSYFFFGDMIVCLGSGITTARPFPTFTSLNQTYLLGDVSYGNATTESRLAKEDSVSTDDIRWVHHNGVGYCLMGSSAVNLSAKTTHGAWDKIFRLYQNKPVSAPLFSLSIAHGNSVNDGSYAYVLLPDCDRQQTRRFALSPDINIVENSTKVQSVTTKDGSLSGSIFYEPHSITLDKGMVLRALDPAIVMVESSGGDLKLTLCDPTQKLSSLRLFISGSYRGQGANYDPNSNTTLITVALPRTEGYRGGSVSLSLTKTVN